MQKRFKTVSMMLFLLGAITGTAYAAPSSVNADDVRITQQSGTCTGVVKDASGETVIGAAVVVKGTTNGTITDFDGAFSLSNIKKGDVIQISFVGYKIQELVWDGSPLDIVLKDDAQALEEVVVVGFGFYDVRRWAKAPYFINRQEKGMYAYADETADYKVAKNSNETGLLNLSSTLKDNNLTEGYLYIQADPLKQGKGWLDPNANAGSNE